MSEVNAWLDAGDPVAVATVISTWGSAPRPAGSRMVISQSGKIAGSVSGGCLEGEVFEQAQAILKGKPASLFHYGVSDDLAWTVGLSCGGEVDVLIEPLTDVHRKLIGALEAERPSCSSRRIQFVAMAFFSSPSRDRRSSSSSEDPMSRSR